MLSTILNWFKNKLADDELDEEYEEVLDEEYNFFYGDLYQRGFEMVWL